MSWLRWFGWAVVGIGCGAVVMIPWVLGNGRGDEVGEGVIVAAICFTVGGAILYFTRRRVSGE
ncbi:hypothetical protein [Actinokineospora alba]|nr:hypothetical protein [Actinokineospora alba]